MIEHRPAALLADPVYCTLPKAPLHIDWTSIPELLRVSMLDLGGIQPVTKAMSEAAGGPLLDKPSDGEIELFRKRGTQFQTISVVLSVIPAGTTEGILSVKPFCVALIPMSKRGSVSHSSIELVSKLNVDDWLRTEPAYTGYDPFKGEWSLYGNLPGYLDGKQKGFLDQFGIVADQFFLATETDGDEILTVDMKMPSEDMKARYEKHRKKLFFTPFQKVEARRVWGTETPIELFLVQALAKENLFPQSQMIIMEDGETFPSLYHLWNDPKFRHMSGLITEADLYFPDERIAIFCDGSAHVRKKHKDRDTAINSKLEKLDIRPIRIPSSKIKKDLPSAVATITSAISETAKTKT